MKKIIFMVGLLAFTVVGCKQEKKSEPTPVVEKQPTMVQKTEKELDSSMIGMGILIGKGKGLCHYVDYQTAIDIAEQCNLKIVAGRGYKRRVVSPTQARKINTDYVPVWVSVKPNDAFNKIGNKWEMVK